MGLLWEERIYPKKELSALGSGVTLTNLLNPTSGSDASHPCLISIEPKEECTNQYLIGERFASPTKINYDVCIYYIFINNKCIHAKSIAPRLSLPSQSVGG